MGGGTTPGPLGIKPIAPIRRQPARGRFNVLVSISLGTVAMISGQSLSSQAARSTGQATSWPFDHWIGIRWSTRIMTRTGLIPQHQAVEEADLTMAMKMPMARLRSTSRVVRTGPGKRGEQRMGRGKGRGQGRGRGRLWRKGRGREMVKGKVLFNEPHGEMISLVPLHCSCRRKCMGQTWTWRAN